MAMMLRSEGAGELILPRSHAEAFRCNIAFFLVSLVILPFPVRVGRLAVKNRIALFRIP